MSTTPIRAAPTATDRGSTTCPRCFGPIDHARTESVCRDCGLVTDADPTPIRAIPGKTKCVGRLAYSMAESHPRQGAASTDNDSSDKSERYKDAEELRSLYHGQLLSSRQIADELGVSKDTINRWLDKHGIEKRGRKEALRLRRLKKPPEISVSESGYIRVRSKLDGKKEGMGLHRLIAVAEHGVEAVADKVVHHKNGVRWDNRPENLELMEWSEHNKHHAIEGEYHEHFNGHRVNSWKRDSKGRFSKPAESEGDSDE